jgi:flagellar export protein FliJ
MDKNPLNAKRMLHERSPRIHLVLTQTEREEQQAMRHWGQLERQLGTEQTQLNELREYAAGYRNCLSSPSGTEASLSGGQIQHTLGFLQQVEQAIKTQTGKIRRLNEQVEEARQRCLALRAKVKGIENLIEKLENEKLCMLEKQEQKQVDEFNNRMFFR